MQTRKKFDHHSITILVIITFCLLISIVTSSSSSSGEVSSLPIAGLFPLSGYLSEYGPSEEAVARIAVNELNPLILPKLYNVTYQGFNTQSSTSGSSQSLITARNTFNMYGVIGCHDSSASIGVAISSSLYYIPQISYASQANSLSDSSLYPFFARVIPPYKTEGYAIASLIELYGWKKVGIIITSDDYGTATAQLLRSQLSKRSVKVTLVQFTSGETSLDAQMSVLRNALVRVIVILPSSTADAKTIITEADRYHLITDQFVYIGGSFASTSEIFYNSTSQSTNQVVKGLARGMIGLRLKGGYGAKYESFLDKWETLDPTIYSGSGKRSIPFYAPFVYDAFELFIRTFMGDPYATLTEYMVNLGNTTFEGLTGKVDLNGGTDRLGIYNIVNLLSSDEGDRGFVIIGEWFEEYASQTRNSSSSSSSGSSKLFESKMSLAQYYDNNVTQISNYSLGFQFQYNPVYRNGLSSIPDPEVRPAVDYWVCDSGEKKTDQTGEIRLDRPGPDAKKIAYHYFCDNFIDCYNYSDESGSCSSNYTAVFIAFGIMAGILIVIALLLIVYTLVFGFYFKYVRVRTSSPPFLIILLLSIILGIGSIFAWFGQPNAVACGFQPWLLGLAVNSMISVLVAKNVRIWRIFKNPLKKKYVQDYEVFIFYAILMIPGIFILFLWTLISTPTALLKEVAGDKHWVCDTGGFTGPPGGLIFFFIFVAYSGLILLFGAIVSFAIRKVPSIFNESRLIAISIYNILFLAAIVIPIFFVLLKFNPFVGWIIRTLAILYAFTATLCLTFVPKIVGMVRDKMDGKSLLSTTVINTTTSNSDRTSDQMGTYSI